MCSAAGTPEEADCAPPTLPPQDSGESSGFPRAEEWAGLEELLQESRAHLLPLPLPQRPRRGARNASSRLRQRARRARGVWRSGVRVLMVLNGLTKGRCGTTTEHRESQKHLIGAEANAAQRCAVQRILSESYRLERGRGGGEHPIGVQALTELLHVGLDEVYGMKRKQGPCPDDR